MVPGSEHRTPVKSHVSNYSRPTAWAGAVNENKLTTAGSLV